MALLLWRPTSRQTAAVVCVVAEETEKSTWAKKAGLGCWKSSLLQGWEDGLRSVSYGSRTCLVNMKQTVNRPARLKSAASAKVRHDWVGCCSALFPFCFQFILVHGGRVRLLVNMQASLLGPRGEFPAPLTHRSIHSLLRSWILHENVSSRMKTTCKQHISKVTRLGPNHQKDKNISGKIICTTNEQ